MKAVKEFLNERTRAYIYAILLALQPLAVGYGLLTEDLAVLWVNVGAAVLGLGLATLKTSTKRKIPDGTGEHRAETAE